MHIYQPNEQQRPEMHVIKLPDSISGELNNLLKMYDAALEIDPENAGIHNDKGYMLYQYGYFESALLCYENALKVDPNHIDAKHNKEKVLSRLITADEKENVEQKVVGSETLKQAGKPVTDSEQPRAVSSGFGVGLPPNFNTAEALYHQGRAYKKLNRHDDALVCFTAALKIDDPKQALPPYEKGYVFFMLDKYDDALACFNIALKNNPKDAAAHNSKGITLYSLGRYTEALASYDAALKINPQHAHAKNNRKRVLAILNERPSSDIKLTELPSPIPALSPELITWIHELKSSGLEMVSGPTINQQLQVWNASGISLSSVKQLVGHIQLRLGQLDNSLAIVNQRLELDSVAQAEQAYINKQAKLVNYQRKLQQELTKFITAYFLATTGTFKLKDDKKGMLLQAIPEVVSCIPMVGELTKNITKIVTNGLQYANYKYRMYQINRLTELFTTIENIEHAVLRLSRQLTLAKEKEIRDQITFSPSGVVGALRGIYEIIKDNLYQQWHDLKLSNGTGLTFKAEEKLAMLDGAFLIEKVLSGKTKIANTIQDLAVVPEFLKAILNNPNYQHQTPTHVWLGISTATTITVVPITAAHYAATASTNSVPTLKAPPNRPALLTSPAESYSTKAALDAERQRREELEAKLDALEKSRLQEKEEREQERAILAKLHKTVEKLATDKGLSVGGDQAQLYVTPEPSSHQRRLSEDMHWRLQMEEQMRTVTVAVVQHGDALRLQSDVEMQRQTQNNRAAKVKQFSVIT